MAQRLATGLFRAEHSLDEWNSPLRETLNYVPLLAERRVRTPVPIVPNPAARA